MIMVMIMIMIKIMIIIIIIIQNDFFFSMIAIAVWRFYCMRNEFIMKSAHFEKKLCIWPLCRGLPGTMRYRSMTGGAGVMGLTSA